MTSLLKKLLDHSLRESLVFPNHEWVCMPWMIDDQENWIPVSKAPFGWINQESSAGFTDCSKSTPGRSTESSFEDVREFDHELLMDELEVNVLESNVSEEVAPSKNSSSTGKIENYEMVAAKAKDWDPSTKTKKFRTVKKMVGASLKKYEKMKVNIIGEETPNLRSSEK